MDERVNQTEPQLERPETSQVPAVGDLIDADDREPQYVSAHGQIGEIGVLLETDANSRRWITVPQASWVMLGAAAAAALVLILALFMHRDLLTVAALLCAALVAIGLPRTVGAPAPRHSSLVALTFSAASILVVRLLDDLYISGIICALSVVAAFGAEMLRKPPRRRLFDSVATTVMTTVAASSAVAIVGLAPHPSWKLALAASSLCVFAAMAVFQAMRYYWPGTQFATRAVLTLPKQIDAWQPGTWNHEDTEVYRGMDAISTFWGINDTARTICAFGTGLIGAGIGALLYSFDWVTGLTSVALLNVAVRVGGAQLATALIGGLVGAFAGTVVVVGNRVLRPTSNRVSLWGAIAWGLLPTIFMALPTYALVRMGG